MTDYLIAVLVIPCLLLGWVLVQRVNYIYALKHPEFGPPRKEGGGCGKSCGCGSKSKCKRWDKHTT